MIAKDQAGGLADRRGISRNGSRSPRPPLSGIFGSGRGGTGRLVFHLFHLLGDRGGGQGDHREGDLLLFGIDLEDPDLDQLLGFDDVDDPTDPAGRQLGDVDQPLDAGFELDEGAEVHQAGHLRGEGLAPVILVLDEIPRAGHEAASGRGRPSG